MKLRNQLIMLATSLPAVATAHVIDATASGFAAGITHTLSGLDHCLVGLGLGVWIAVAARRGIARRSHAMLLAAVVAVFGTLHGYAMAAGAAYALGAGLTLLGVFVAGALSVQLLGTYTPRRFQR